MKKSDIKNGADLLLYKALIDFNSGVFLYESFENPDIDIDIDIDKVYFDFQQSAEKFIKSILSHHNIVFKKTHDIEELIRVCNENNIVLMQNIEQLIELNEYAVDGRYSIVSDDIEDASHYINLLSILAEDVKKDIGDKS